jgi:hypothetical protein
VKIQLLDTGGNPTREKWEEVADIIFTPEGKRVEKVVYAPVSTLVSLSLTPEDLQDLRNVQPFVLTTAEVQASATSKARSGWTIAICRS